MATKKKRKNPAAVALGRRGGRKTAENLTPEQRSESARQAAMARWAKKKDGGEDLMLQPRKILSGRVRLASGRQLRVEDGRIEGEFGAMALGGQLTVSGLPKNETPTSPVVFEELVTDAGETLSGRGIVEVTDRWGRNLATLTFDGIEFRNAGEPE